MGDQSGKFGAPKAHKVCGTECTKAFARGHVSVVTFDANGTVLLVLICSTSCDHALHWQGDTPAPARQQSLIIFPAHPSNQQTHIRH